MVRRALFIRNGRSRQGGADLIAARDVFQRHGLALVEMDSESAEQVGQLILEHRRQVDSVILGGGDGTLRCAAAALLETQLPLGILPMGTANDLARTLHVPLDLAQAAEVIAAGRERRVDLGTANEQFFFNVAHIGLGTRVKTNLSPELKKQWGSLSYPRALLQSVAERRSFSAVLEHDGGTERLRSIEIAVGNGRYFGGGVAVDQEAEIHDGVLHVCSFAPVNFWRLLRAMVPWQTGGKRDAETVCQFQTRQLTVRTRRPMKVSADGEIITQTPVVFSVLPRAIPVFA